MQFCQGDLLKIGQIDILNWINILVVNADFYGYQISMVTAKIIPASAGLLSSFMVYTAHKLASFITN